MKIWPVIFPGNKLHAVWDWFVFSNNTADPPLKPKVSNKMGHKHVRLWALREGDWIPPSPWACQNQTREEVPQCPHWGKGEGGGGHGSHCTTNTDSVLCRQDLLALQAMGLAARCHPPTNENYPPGLADLEWFWKKSHSYSKTSKILAHKWQTDWLNEWIRTLYTA